ncbi:MAG: hypothetical protein H0U74_21665 [Bradymonadaceae bacterium]|nr:hypothetical protein [Lujinxingiaceae bacterium]
MFSTSYGGGAVRLAAASLWLLVLAMACATAAPLEPDEALVGVRQVVASEAARAFDDVALRFRVSSFASHFWVIDQLSRWDGRLAGPHYQRYFDTRFGLGEQDLAVLAAYAEVRRAHSGAMFVDAPDSARPIDLLAPPLSYEHFALSFLQAGDVEQAVATLELRGRDAASVRTVFGHFKERIDVLLLQADHLDSARDKLEALGVRGELRGYLARMASFFEVGDRLGAELVVEIVWAPDGYAQATQFGPHMVIPLPVTSALEEADLAGWLGVVVHELGHFFLSCMGSEQRWQASQRILNEVGVVNARRANVVDEALATALGNIVFMGRAFPEYVNAHVFYSYDPDYEYPYAIDSLARALAPHIEERINAWGSFDAGFVERVIAVHREVFLPMPRHHTRIALVYADDAQHASHFAGLFPGISQWHQVGNEAAFAADSTRRATLTRWVLTTASGVLADPERTQILAIPLLDRLARRVLAGRETACLQAQRRSTNGPFDFVAVGRTADDVRRLLIYAHTHVGIPADGAICLGND